MYTHTHTAHRSRGPSCGHLLQCCYIPQSTECFILSWPSASSCHAEHPVHDLLWWYTSCYLAWLPFRVVGALNDQEKPKILFPKALQEEEAAQYATHSPFTSQPNCLQAVQYTAVLLMVKNKPQLISTNRVQVFIQKLTRQLTAGCQLTRQFYLQQNTSSLRIFFSNALKRFTGGVSTLFVCLKKSPFKAWSYPYFLEFWISNSPSLLRRCSPYKDCFLQMFH